MPFGKKPKTDKELRLIIKKNKGTDGLSKKDLTNLASMYRGIVRTLETKKEEERKKAERKIRGLEYEKQVTEEEKRQLGENNYKLYLKENDLITNNKKLQKSLDATVNNLEERNTECKSLSEKLEKTNNTVSELNSQVSELKAPFKYEDLKELVGEHINETYQQIKEALVRSFLIDPYISYGALGRDKEPNETEQLLITNDIQSYGDDGKPYIVGTRIQFSRNNYLLSNEKINNLKIDFNKPNDEGTDLRNDFSVINFKHINTRNKETGYGIQFSLWCRKDNIYREMIMQNAALYVKVALMGEVKKRIENRDFSTAKNIIKNNELEEFALPYIRNNIKDKPEMIAYFANLIQEK